MKDGFKSIEIEPAEGYLDFIGPAKSENTSEPARVLKGQVRFTLVKPVKIRNMSVKFKGFSNITLEKPSNLEISSPLLPHLKLPLFGRASLPAGDHVIPWEIDIPNIYPRSLLIKRASINYKIILSISTGLTRRITAEYPIVLRRHLLPYKELAPIIETRLFQRTIPGKFHYEVDAPQIVCIEQDYIPMAIKYISFANHKPVQSIRTRLVQIELYRRQSLSKQDADLSATNRDSLVFDLDKKISDMVEYKDTHIKYIKRTVPALIHIPDGSTSSWKRPCLVRHRLHPYLSYTLDSPLVSIYHQLEVTFQFGMKYEEVRAKIPIIIASVPRKEPTQPTASPEDTMMMKYAFEEVAHSEFLTYKLESRSSTQRTTDDDNINDDNYSVLRDTNLLSPTSEDDDTQRSDRVTPIMFVKQNGRLPPAAIPSPGPMQTYRRALSPTPASNTTLAVNSSNRRLKKFASAFDLSTSSQESPHPLDYDEPLEERPRTTTPTMRRHNVRKPLQPINVDLANGKEFAQNRAPLPPPQTELPPPPPPPQAELPPPPTSNTMDSSSSDVLPAIDRVQQRKKHWASHHHDTTTTPNMSTDDLRSVYSDTTSISSVHNAPSLSSSATFSTNKSHPTLHSRPPSPVFSPAPGLPATIALRPQQQDDAIEEMFPPDSAMSPAMNTVASSTILTPRTSYALRRRIALSTISSLTNDSLQLGPSAMNSRGRNSSTVDPDVQSLLMHSSRYSSSISSVDYPPPPVVNRYAFARLPPIPTATTSSSSNNNNNTNNSVKANRRMTKLYMEDSDDEDQDPMMAGEFDRARSPSPPPMPQLQQMPSFTAITNSNNASNRDLASNTAAEEEDCAPPRLPRLSFGKDFGISLGI